MAFGKRQLVLAALVLALGAAVYINWQFTDNENLMATNIVTSTKELGEAAYVNNEVTSQTTTTTVNSETTQNQSTTNSEPLSASEDYFNQAQLARQKSRDEAMDLLKEIIESAKSTDQAKATAVEQVAAISKNIEQEANIENLLKAKGFSNCVAFIQNGECSVVISCPKGLLESDAITIKDVVYGQTCIPYDKIKIIEAKY